MRKPHGPPKSEHGSSESTPVEPRRSRGRRRGDEFTRRLDVGTELEYLEEALEEAEAAARWYAERSVAAAAGFSDEIDAAESAIVEFPDAWPSFDHGTRRYLLRRYPFSIILRRREGLR